MFTKIYSDKAKLLIMTDMPNLQVQILPGFTISNPLMIASSHLTANCNALRQLARLRPSAVTLKTTSSTVGGSGEGGRIKAKVLDLDGDVAGIYTDGKKTAEFLNIDPTKALMQAARELLPSTAIGLSVLQDTNEDYKGLAAEFRDYDYVEFNLKYSLRGDRTSALQSFSARFNHLWEDLLVPDIRRFVEAFKDKPILIKLPRELGPVIPSREWTGLWESFADANAQGKRIGLIVANSLRCRIPPMLHTHGAERRTFFSELSDGVLHGTHGAERRTFFSELSDGVLHGPPLFAGTYDLIRRICEAGLPWRRVPVIAVQFGPAEPFFPSLCCIYREMISRRQGRCSGLLERNNGI